MKNTFYAAIIFGLLTACNTQPSTETTEPETVTSPTPEAPAAPAEGMEADSSAPVVDTTAAAQ